MRVEKLYFRLWFNLRKMNKCFLSLLVLVSELLFGICFCVDRFVTMSPAEFGLRINLKSRCNSFL